MHSRGMRRERRNGAIDLARGMTEGKAEWGYRTRAGMTAGEAKCDYVIKLRGNDGRRGGMRLCARAGMMAGVGNAATRSGGIDGGLSDRCYAIALISSLA